MKEHIIIPSSGQIAMLKLMGYHTFKDEFEPYNDGYEIFAGLTFVGSIKSPTNEKQVCDFFINNKYGIGYFGANSKAIPIVMNDYLRKISGNQIDYQIQIRTRIIAEWTSYALLKLNYDYVNSTFGITDIERNTPIDRLFIYF